MINLDRIKASGLALCVACDRLAENKCQNISDCDDCKWNQIENCINFLKEEYKQKIKLTQFEYDLLINCKETHGYNENDIIEKYWIIEGMKQKGYFKNIKLSMNFKEVLDRAVIVDEQIPTSIKFFI